MPSEYSLQYALAVALDGESQAPRTTIACTSILLKEIFRQANTDNPSIIDARATPENLEKGINELLGRIQFSPRFLTCMDMMSDYVTNDILKSSVIVAGINAWERLPNYKKERVLQGIANVCSIAVHGMTGRHYGIIVRSSSTPAHADEFCTLKGTPQNYIHPSFTDIGDEYLTINLNTHPQVGLFDEPFCAIQEIYAGGMRLLQHAMVDTGKSSNGRNVRAGDIEDYRNLSWMTSEEALVPRNLPTFYFQQCDISAANFKAAEFVSRLETQFYRQSDSILEKRSVMEKISTLFTFGSMNP